MNILVIADSFPPLKNSASIQLEDLCHDFYKRNINVNVITPCHSKVNNYSEGDIFNIYRLGYKNESDKSYFNRLFFEFFWPIKVLFNLKRIQLKNINLIIWYSPSIFLTPLILALSVKFKCKNYLILRDIFPRWAYDLRIISNKLIYQILYFFYYIQFLVADKVGIQSEGNIKFIPKLFINIEKIEVLNNWLTVKHQVQPVSYILDKKLDGRKLFIYSGNVGVAQGFDSIYDLIFDLRNDNRIGFIIVGKGSRFKYYMEKSIYDNLNNVIFMDEINIDKLHSLYKKVSFGIVALDFRHSTHNIPGKFISYMHASLPVLASINPNNDLAKIITDNKVGEVNCNMSRIDLKNKALLMFNNLNNGFEYRDNCKNLYEKLYRTESAASQILKIIY